MKELEKDIEAMRDLVFKEIKDPNIKRRNSITDFSFKKKRDRQVVEIYIGGKLAVANQTMEPHICKRSEGHESHLVDGEVLLGRGWGRKPSEVSFPSMFAPDNDFNDYIIGREENRFSKLEWRAQFKPSHEIIKN